MHPPGPENGEARDLAGCSRLSEKNISNAADTVADSTREGKPNVHVLRTNGIVVEATLDPSTFEFKCVWNPPAPYGRKKLKRILPAYLAWRNGIMDAAAKRAGIRVIVATPGLGGESALTVLGVDS